MATTTYNESEIDAHALAANQAAYPGKAAGPRSFLRQQARALAQLLAQQQAAVRDADRDGVPASEVVDGVLRARCSSARLDEWATVFGLPSNRAAGAFGRNGATVATDGAGPVTGTPATIVSTGALLRDESGTVQVELVSGVTVPAGGSIAGAFQATAAGAAGNLAAGTKLYWVSPPVGLSGSVTLSTALSGGYDAESDLALLDRLLGWLRSQPHGGTLADVRRWAEESKSSTGARLGIVRGYAYKHRRGVGSTDVVALQAGTGQGRDPGATKALAVQAWIDALRLPSEDVRVVRPRFPSDQKLKLKLQVVPTSKNAFDWVTTAGVTIGSATTTTITVATADVPATLSAAVSAGTKPRVQVSLPSVSPLPYERRIASASTAMGNTTYTLASALPASPSGLLWAGGGAVAPVAIAALTYVDSVGPSQQSGLHDTITDAWEAVVSIGRIAQAVVGALDASGARAVVYSPDVGIGVGVQIAVGSGSYSGADFLLYDNVPGEGPQLPEVAAIVVRGT